MKTSWRYRYGSIRWALQVSMRLKRRAEAVAPFGVALNNQLPSQGKGPDGVLDEVRVDRDPAVLDVTDELRPLGIQVMQRFTEEAARRDTGAVDSSHWRSSLRTGVLRSSRAVFRASSLLSFNSRSMS